MKKNIHINSNYQLQFDEECAALYKSMISTKKRFGRNTPIFKKASQKYKLCFEEKIQKKFWDLLKQGFNNNKVGDIIMQ